MARVSFEQALANKNPSIEARRQRMYPERHVNYQAGPIFDGLKPGAQGAAGWM
jgi:hypothetical protein